MVKQKRTVAAVICGLLAGGGVGRFSPVAVAAGRCRVRRPRVVVFDYGSGNVRSAQQALERAGADVTVTADAMTARHADGLMVPGVGAFAECMRGLVAAGGAEVVEYRVTAERPILGVCVGAQVLFTSSTEHDTATKGLGVFEGAVTRLDATRGAAHGLEYRRRCRHAVVRRDSRRRTVLFCPFLCREAPRRRHRDRTR